MKLHESSRQKKYFLSGKTCFQAVQLFRVLALVYRVESFYIYSQVPVNGCKK